MNQQSRWPHNTSQSLKKCLPRTNGQIVVKIFLYFLEQLLVGLLSSENTCCNLTPYAHWCFASLLVFLHSSEVWLSFSAEILPTLFTLVTVLWWILGTQFLSHNSCDSYWNRFPLDEVPKNQITSAITLSIVSFMVSR